MATPFQVLTPRVLAADAGAIEYTYACMDRCVYACMYIHVWMCAYVFGWKSNELEIAREQQQP